MEVYCPCCGEKVKMGKPKRDPFTKYSYYHKEHKCFFKGITIVDKSTTYQEGEVEITFY